MVGWYHKTEVFWKGMKQLMDFHLTTIPEMIDEPRSDCHAWGSFMLYEFSHCILSVNVQGGEICICLKAPYISQAEGWVTTILGEVYVTYEMKGIDTILQVRRGNNVKAPIKIWLSSTKQEYLKKETEIFHINFY